MVKNDSPTLLRTSVLMMVSLKLPSFTGTTMITKTEIAKLQWRKDCSRYGSLRYGEFISVCFVSLPDILCPPNGTSIFTPRFLPIL